YSRSLGYSYLAQNLRHFLHGIITTNRTKQIAQLVRFNTSIGKSATTRESTSTTIRSRQCFFNLVYPWILKNVEFLGDNIQNNCCNRTYYPQGNQRNQY